MIKSNVLSKAVEWLHRRDGRFEIPRPSDFGYVANPVHRVGYGARLRLLLTQFPGHESGVGSSPTLVKIFLLFAVFELCLLGVHSLGLSQKRVAIPR